MTLNIKFTQHNDTQNIETHLNDIQHIYTQNDKISTTQQIDYIATLTITFFFKQNDTIFHAMLIVNMLNVVMLSVVASL